MNDHTLIEVRFEKKAGVFLASFVLATTVLIILWGSVMDRFIQLKTPFSFTTTEANIARLVKGIRAPNPEIAIVGSSLSQQLEPGLFSRASVINLSVGGGSVMTGLEILSSIPLPPKFILVEINILDRSVDEEVKIMGIAAAQSRPWAIMSGVSKPLRYILAKPLFSYFPQEEQTAWWSQKLAALRSLNVATYDIQSTVSAGLISWGKRNNWDLANRNFKRIQELIPRLESRGAKVFLLNLPYTERYDNHAYARRNREISGGDDAFSCHRCIDVRDLVFFEELRWGDGAHLDDRSALIVAEGLERHLL